MKAILLSIRPEHLVNILNGKKTVEIRKSKLPLNVPVYLYCTKGKPQLGCHTVYKSNIRSNENGIRVFTKLGTLSKKDYFNGKVVAKCIFSEVDNYELTYKFNGDWAYLIPEEDLKKTCLPYEEVEAYGDPKPLYFYHITNLEIFNEPKELSEFNRCDGFIDCCKCKYYPLSNNMGVNCKYRPITKAPQSWCYVEELK